MSLSRKLVLLGACLAGACATPSPDVPDTVVPKSATVVRYLAILDGEPGARAIARARAAGKRMSSHDRQALAAGVRGGQEPVVAAMRAHGWKVRRRHALVLNAVEVDLNDSDVDALRALPGVARVVGDHVLQGQRDANMAELELPPIWGGVPGLTGRGKKIAVLDTGIDYTHVDFGGAGTPEAFAAAQTSAVLVPGPKVTRGHDFIDDDANPIDCHGHGTAVAGIAAGYGVTSDRVRYPGPYDAATIDQPFYIAPGAAPEAEIYAVRVLGCDNLGTFAQVLAGMEWVAASDADVANISLSSRGYSLPDDPLGLAGDALVDAGILVAASTGNASGFQYVVAAPATGDKVIAVAGSQAHPTLPAYRLVVPTATGPRDILAQSRNGKLIAAGTFPVKYLAGTAVCDATRYQNGQVTGMLVVINGFPTCYYDALLAAQAGGAVGVISTTPTLTYVSAEPSTIFRPRHFIPGGFTINNEGDALVAAAGQLVTVSNTEVANPGHGVILGFSSGGPRAGDYRMKPDLAAPGAIVGSGESGTGTDRSFGSGTSNAAPVIAALATLMLERRPELSLEQIRQAIISTADPTAMRSPGARRIGAGLVQLTAALETQLIARADDGAAGVSFGLIESSEDVQRTGHFLVTNLGATPVTLTTSTSIGGNVVGSPNPLLHTPSVPAVIEVGPHATVRVPLTISFPLAAARDAPVPRQAIGHVRLTPSTGPALSVPYIAMVRPLAEVEAELDENTVSLGNLNATMAATAELYSWALAGDGTGALPTRAIGVRAATVNNVRMVSFAWTMEERYSNPDQLELSIDIDRNGDGTADARVFTRNSGLLATGQQSGNVACAVQTLPSGPVVTGTISAPFDSTTQTCTVKAADLGLSSAAPRFRMTATARLGFAACTTQPGCELTPVPGAAWFNAFAPALTDSAGGRATLAPLASATVTLTRNAAETPPRGLMVVVLDNHSRRQAHVWTMAPSKAPKRGL